MVQEKENFKKKVVDFRVRISLTLLSCREIKILERN